MGQRKATTPINMYQANPRDMLSTTETVSGNISTRGFGEQRHAHGGPVHQSGHANLAFAHRAPSACRQPASNNFLGYWLCNACPS